jgi:hypothetical protein
MSDNSWMVTVGIDMLGPRDQSKQLFHRVTNYKLMLLKTVKVFVFPIDKQGFIFQGRSGGKDDSLGW